jgi:hypothetical protein
MEVPGYSEYPSVSALSTRAGCEYSRGGGRMREPKWERAYMREPKWERGFVRRPTRRSCRRSRTKSGAAVLERRSSPSVPRLRARVCVSGGVFVSVWFSVIFICLVVRVCVCLCVGVLERFFQKLVCLFVRSEFDVIVYSELYRSNGHHQPWLSQVPANAPATRLPRACNAHCASRRARAPDRRSASTGDRRRRFSRDWSVRCT